MRATKLICTIGPASVHRVEELVEAGMDVARINCSHGRRADHERTLRAIRDAIGAARKPVGIMVDLSGPKVRLGELVDGEIRLEVGESFALRSDRSAPGDGAGAPTTYPELASDLEVGDRVLLADGAVELRVVEESGSDVITEVVRAGTVRSRAGVNVPSERLGIPPITPKDEEDVAWAVGSGVDIVAQSFVRRAEDVEDLRSRLGQSGPLLLAKIETRSAVEDAEQIVAAADAIMVARGDLGVESDLEEIPVLQRELIARAVAGGIPVVVATQMLESMVHAPRPTRAEAGDVANAVFEGVDAVMLSAETAIGDFPIEAASTATRIAEIAETRGLQFFSPIDERRSVAPSDSHALAQAAARIARAGTAVAVACFTYTGRTPTLLSASRPRAPIVALSPNERVVRRLTLYQSVVPLISRTPDNTDDMIELMDEALRETGCARPGDPAVLVASSPFGHATTNLLKLHRVGPGAS